MVRREQGEHQAVRLADGRLLGFAEYGDLQGEAVLAFHREVGSRLLARVFDGPARDLGVRIVSPDRPGMGFSDFQDERVIGGWPADVAELAEQLGMERFAVVGVAAGAAYALACAWRLPELVTRAAVVSPGLPVSQTELPPDTPRMQRLLSQSAARAPWTIRPVMAALGQLSRRAPEQALGRIEESAGEADRPILARPEIREMLGQSMAETFRSGPRGPAHDLRLAAVDWGVALERTSAKVDVWHGEADTPASQANARRLAGELPSGERHAVPGAGHHLDLARPELVLAGLRNG